MEVGGKWSYCSAISRSRGEMIIMRHNMYGVITHLAKRAFDSSIFRRLVGNIPPPRCAQQ